MDDHIIHFSFRSMDDDPEFPPGLIFRLCNKFFSLNIEYSQDGITPEQWAELIDATKNGGEYTLEFLDSNGTIEITVANEDVLFNVGRYGGDNCGEMTLTLNGKLCIDAFQQAHDALVDYLKKQ